MSHPDTNPRHLEQRDKFSYAFTKESIAMFNRPDINVKKSPRDQAERIYWIARTIDVLGTSMIENCKSSAYSMHEYGKMLRTLTDEIQTESLDLIDFN